MPRHFLIVESWPSTLTEDSEACGSSLVVLGSFMTSWMTVPLKAQSLTHGLVTLSRRIHVSDLLNFFRSQHDLLAFFTFLYLSVSFSFFPLINEIII